MYLGSGSTANKVTKGYIGSSGVAHSFWTGGQGDYNKLILGYTGWSAQTQVYFTSEDAGQTWTQHSDINGYVGTIRFIGIKDNFIYGAHIDSQYHSGDQWSGDYRTNTLYIYKINSENPTAMTLVSNTNILSSDEMGTDMLPGKQHINQVTGDIYFPFSLQWYPHDTSTYPSLYYVCVTASTPVPTQIQSGTYYQSNGSPIYDRGWTGAYSFGYNDSYGTYGPLGGATPVMNTYSSSGPSLTGLPNSTGCRMKIGGSSSNAVTTNTPYVYRGKIDNQPPNGGTRIQGSYYSGEGYSSSYDAPSLLCKFKNYLYEQYSYSYSSSESGGSGTSLDIFDVNSGRVSVSILIAVAESVSWLPLPDKLISLYCPQYGVRKIYYTEDGTTFTAGADLPYPSALTSPTIHFFSARVNGGGYFYW